MRNKGVRRSIPFRLLQPNEEAMFNRIGEVGLTWHPSLNTEENRSPQMRKHYPALSTFHNPSILIGPSPLTEFSMFSILTSNIFALQFLPELFRNSGECVSAGHWFSKDNTVPK
jgi:hypothetical protein